MYKFTGTQPDRQLAVPTPDALSRSSAGHGGGQGSGDTPPSSPRCNVHDSYWSQPRATRTAAWLPPEPDAAGVVARYLDASGAGEARMSALIHAMDEDRENDPRSRSGHSLDHLNIRLAQFEPFSLTPGRLAGLIALQDPGSVVTAPQSSASSTTSAAAATQQDIAASGCRIPPPCAIL